MSDFTVVPDADFPESKTGGNRPSALSLALESGSVVFVESYPKGLGNKDGYLRRRGFHVATRSGERDGVKGFYVRASKNGAA